MTAIAPRLSLAIAWNHFFGVAWNTLIQSGICTASSAQACIQAAQIADTMLLEWKKRWV